MQVLILLEFVVLNFELVFVVDFILRDLENPGLQKRLVVHVAVVEELDRNFSLYRHFLVLVLHDHLEDEVLQREGAQMRAFVVLQEVEFEVLYRDCLDCDAIVVERRLWRVFSGGLVFRDAQLVLIALRET